MQEDAADIQQGGVNRQPQMVASTMHLHEGRHLCKTDKIPGRAGVDLPFSGWWYRYFLHDPRQNGQSHL